MERQNPWQDTTFAAEYMREAGNPERGWYEHFVNFPSIVRLIPEDARRILDFGCGPGDFTAKLANHYSSVDGCDNSRAMLELATQAYPEATFFEWDFIDEPPADKEPYDVIVAKAVVHFIEDIELLVQRFKELLDDSGVVIISVPHPVQTVKKVDNYWHETPYTQQIGQYDLYDTMIHRSIEWYISAFTQGEFVLSGIEEPDVPPEILSKYGANSTDYQMPKRLNLRFQKS